MKEKTKMLIAINILIIVFIFALVVINLIQYRANKIVNEAKYYHMNTINNKNM